MSRWQRFWDWCLGGNDALEKRAGEEPTGAYFYRTTFKRGVEAKPTIPELADLLQQLTLEGMPPRAQADHAAFHWPGMVREEDEPDVSE